MHNSRYTATVQEILYIYYVLSKKKNFLGATNKKHTPEIYL